MFCNRVIAVAVLFVASCAALVGNVQATVLPGGSSLISTLDYSDQFTQETASRDLTQYYAGGDATDAYYNIEQAYHALPTVQWRRSGGFGFNKMGVNSVLPDPGGNSGAASGVAQSGGGDWGIMYNSLRNDYVVQLDGIIPSGSTLSIASRVANAGGIPPWEGYNWMTGGLDVQFTRGTIDLVRGYNPVSPGEVIRTATGLTTGIAADDMTFHNFAVRFNKAANSLSIYVDQTLKGDLDLTTFAGGGYQTYSSGSVGTGIGGFIGYVDNFQVGAPIPEPSTVVLFVTGLLGLLAYAWRKQK